MSIRVYKKDHAIGEPQLELVWDAIERPVSANPLVFWTNHPTESCEVDFTPFAEGKSRPARVSPLRWKGDISGRPRLIAQLQPAFEAILNGAARNTVSQAYRSLLGKRPTIGV